MKIIDSHCHYNLEPIFSGKPSHFSLEDNNPLLQMTWKNHWQKALEKNVTGAVVVGSNIENSLSSIEIAKNNPQIVAAIGIHPHHALDNSLEEFKTFFENNLPHPEVKAIGETGLDYFRLNKTTEEFKRTQQAQQKLFRLQLQIAKRYKLPVIVHVRDDSEDAYWETLEILKQEYSPDLKFVLHCASGPTRYITEALSMGAYIGFDGNIGYKNAGDLRSILKRVPLDKILIETDAPYLPPQGYRGQVCEPWMIAETAVYLEKEFDLDLDLIYKNTQEFFKYSFEKK
ncbi:MAG: TatD family hydrolase [Candidatus Pacebacteria bacterium]|nr:TatD family hydrolase [Candidatus Paceibacterota bacterium]MBT4652237.1 TatD family hydrolase [Candidatus Paceibacterota bacterium]MBT6756649.1 TatD family hydrolase [Candidatus Paceibacterota bacterium]MBT6921435.1 TatD family hydrolase [Candidatus Paceibacterota bacterium]